jgi:tetratricopeptide (TPR) repeat protein
VPQFDANRRMRFAVVALAAAGVVTVVSLWPRGEDTGPTDTARAAASRARGTSASARREAPGTTIGGEKAAFVDDRRGGGLAYQSGNYEEALSIYRAALARDPDDSETLSNMGQVLVRLQRTEEALPLFQRAIRLAPDRWAYRFNLARAHGLLGNWTDAVAEYQAARQLFPNDYATEFNLGLALHKAGNEAEAVEAYTRAIALEPNDAAFHLALGNSYEKLRRTGDAAAAYIRYVELAPDAPDAEKVRARILQLANASQSSASAVSR